jgi:hypothetical protein
VRGAQDEWNAGTRPEDGVIRKSAAVNGGEVVSDVRSWRLGLGVRTKGFMAMPIELERAPEGSTNVRVFVRNGIACLTLDTSGKDLGVKA